MLNSRDLVTTLGSYTSVSGGREWLFSCPSCHKRKLYVNPRTGRGYCQRCTRTFNFKKGKLDPWTTSLSSAPTEAIERRNWLGLPRGSHPLFAAPETLPSVPDRLEQIRAQRYLFGRGFTAEDAAPFNLHFCGDGKYRGRILFPVTYHGEVWTFIARDYWGTVTPKVLHPPSTGKEEEHLALLGLDLCLSAGIRDAVLVEGPFDAMAVGSPPAIALHGTSLKGITLHVLLDAFDRFVLFLDPDAPGQTHAQQLFAQLQACGRPVALIRKVSDDPAALGRIKCQSLIRQAFEALDEKA